MAKPAIILENISKRYRLGMVGSGTLREDIVGWYYKVRGKEDPYSLMPKQTIGRKGDHPTTFESVKGYQL